MKIKVKQFNVDMEVKNKGIEFEVRSPDGQKQIGDVVLSKTGLTWCKGQTSVANGIKVSWDEFIEWAES